MPSAASSVHSMSSSAGPRKRMQSRTASAPCRSTKTSGPTAAPERFEILLLPSVTQPFEKKLANGSRKPT